MSAPLRLLVVVLLGGCRPSASESATPEPPSEPPPTASSPAPQGEAPITVEGEARDAKAGAVVLVDGQPWYLDGMAAWPPEILGRRVRVQGRPQTREGVPASSTPAAGIVGTYRVLQDATFDLVDPSPVEP